LLRESTNSFFSLLFFRRAGSILFQHRDFPDPPGRDQGDKSVRPLSDGGGEARLQVESRRLNTDDDHRTGVIADEGDEGGEREGMGADAAVLDPVRRNDADSAGRETHIHRIDDDEDIRVLPPHDSGEILRGGAAVEGHPAVRGEVAGDMVACAVVAAEGVSDPEEQVHGRSVWRRGRYTHGCRTNRKKPE